jgi:nicotinate-nucleotide pyrophosphorylase (carboxylating)
MRRNDGIILPPPAGEEGDVMMDMETQAKGTHGDSLSFWNLTLDAVVRNALMEDIGAGDVTTLSTVPHGKTIEGKFIAKESGVVCGMPAAARAFALMDPEIAFTVRFGDGAAVESGTVIAEISGRAQPILSGERVALNFLQRLSGIATRTRLCVDAVKTTKARIADTRKTTPGLRALEKYAVKTGGGSNHRLGLSDGVLIKDNHIEAAGGIKAAVEAARKSIPHTLKIEVEAENEGMIREALDCGADIIMLDNMGIDEMASAVKLIGGRALVEASGNIGDKDLLKVAQTGVDIISIGALTHTVRAMDISLRFA